MGKTAVAGFGCAGYHAAQAIRARRPEETIHVYTDVGEGPANPMLTTYYAAGRIPREGMFPFGDLARAERELGLRIFRETPAVRLRAADRTLVLADGTERQYDRIVIATGAEALVPPLPRLPCRGVYAMRTPADGDKLRAILAKKTISSALVVGASMVGVKVVEALADRGIPVALADLADRIFPLAALPEISEEIHGKLRRKGVELLFGRALNALEEDGDGIAALFGDGSAYRAEAVFFCVGTRPALRLLEPGALSVGRGIRVDDRMQTSLPHIYAAGDCCETIELTTGVSMPVGLWANAAAQGKIAGVNASGGDARWQGSLIHNITHYWDTDFIGLGDNRAEGMRITYTHPRDGWRFDAVVRDGRPLCINILNNRALAGPARAALVRGIAVPEEPLGPAARLVLRQCGLPERIVAAIGGVRA